MPTHLGSAAIDAAYLGSSGVDKIYLGGAVAYSAVTVPGPPTNVQIVVNNQLAAPTGLTASGGDGTLDLSWSAPAGTITDYSVEYTPSGGSATTVLVGSAATSYQLTGLTNDTEYSVRVAAVSAAGTGAYSTAVTGTPSAAPTDPDFANVVLLLHMDGADGSTTFTDSSSYGRTATVVRNAAISTTQSRFGGASGYFSGGTTSTGISQTADTVLFPDSNDFDMGTGDWTMEAWVYVTSLVNSMSIWAQREGDNFGIIAVPFWRINTDGTLRFQWYTSNEVTVTNVTTSETIATNQWHHVAVVRNSGVVSIYIDGSAATLTGTNDTADYLTSNADVSIGSGADAASSSGWGDRFTGYIDEFRWTIGTARYTANFTPPTAAFPDS